LNIRQTISKWRYIVTPGKNEHYDTCNAFLFHRILYSSYKLLKMVHFWPPCRTLITQYYLHINDN